MNHFDVRRKHHRNGSQPIVFLVQLQELALRRFAQFVERSWKEWLYQLHEIVQTLGHFWTKMVLNPGALELSLKLRPCHKSEVSQISSGKRPTLKTTGCNDVANVCATVLHNRAKPVNHVLRN